MRLELVKFKGTEEVVGVRLFPENRDEAELLNALAHARPEFRVLDFEAPKVGFLELAPRLPSRLLESGQPAVAVRVP